MIFLLVSKTWNKFNIHFFWSLRWWYWTRFSKSSLPHQLFFMFLFSIVFKECLPIFLLNSLNNQFHFGSWSPVRIFLIFSFRRLLIWSVFTLLIKIYNIIWILLLLLLRLYSIWLVHQFYLQLWKRLFVLLIAITISNWFRFAIICEWCLCWS